MKYINNDRTRSQSLTAFTLIELLVVIAIISLLVSILIPSLTKAKELAQKTVCQTQLRSFHMAFMFYAEDNAGKIIDRPTWPPFGALDDSLDYNWPSYLAPYFDLPPRDYHSIPTDTWGTSWLNSPVKNIFDCPAVTGLRDVSYSLNFDLARIDGGGGVHSLSDEDEHASQCMRMGETGNSWLIYTNVLYDPEALCRRHSDGGNYLFCDGHIEWVPAEMGIWTWNNSDHSLFLFGW